MHEIDEHMATGVRTAATARCARRSGWCGGTNPEVAGTSRVRSVAGRAVAAMLDR